MALYRIGVIRFITIFICFEIAVAFLNYLLDPLWCFSNVNRFNASAIVIDSRLQKTNLVTFGSAGYDTLILGSSRTESLNGKDFKGAKAFNYALPALYPDEYAEYIKFFKNRNGSPIRKIYLGLDFFGSSKEKLLASKPPIYYHSLVLSRGYRMTSLLSPDPLLKSLKGYLNTDVYCRYDRRYNISIPMAMTEADRERFIANRLAAFRDFCYANGKYSYDENFKRILTSVVKENSDIKIEVFTSPISSRLFEQLVRQGRYRDYERWLKETVSIFGTVCNFMTLNTVTTDMGNFFDADHFYPAVGTLMVHRLQGIQDPALPVDFGDEITNGTIESYLTAQRRKVVSHFGERAVATGDITTNFRSGSSRGK